MSSVTKGFTLNLTNTIPLPDLGYINELARMRNFEFGGGFTRVPPILEDLYNLFYQEREEGLDFAFENHVFTTETIKGLLGRELTESEIAYYGYTVKFLQGLDYCNCPGFSPMDKSLNVIMYMTHLSEKNNQSHQDPKGSGKQNVTPESLNQMIKDMSNGVTPPGAEAEGADGKTPNLELNKDVVSCVRDFLYDLSPQIANIYGKEDIASMPINNNIMRDIKVKAYLEDKVGLETSLDRKLVENNSSPKKKIKQMTSHTQVMKTNKTSMILPNFDDKFAKKELVVKEKVKPETKKQMLTMLLDDSGSMNSLQKQSYVRAVLLNRLESVMTGKSKLNFYLYESKRYFYKEITNLKEAQDLFKTISLRRPGGGGTNIGYVLQETIDEIANVPGYHHPEIIIVNDGDDHVDPKSIDTKGVRINVIMLGTTNDNLSKIAKDSGGFCISEKMYDRY